MKDINYIGILSTDNLKITNFMIKIKQLTQSLIWKAVILMKTSQSQFGTDGTKKNTSIMLKEILEQPKVVQNLLEKCITANDTVMLNLPLNIENIMISASGSSYNCAAIAAPLFREMLGIPCEYEYSSEFVLQKEFFIRKNSLYIFISQSGETSDTLQAAKLIKNLGGKTLCITNAENSTLWNLCDYRILSDAGEERSIASTKALCAQLLCMMFIILKIKFAKAENIDAEIRALKRLPAYLERVLNNIDKIEIASYLISKYKNIVILGNKTYYPVAKEGALKIKETSYLNVMAYPFGEFMHGHVAVLNQKSVVIAIIDEENEISARRNIQKIKADYNPKIICITSVKDADLGDLNIYIKTGKKIKAIFGSLITLQLIACKIAEILKKNPDRPKGLKKVVID